MDYIGQEFGSLSLGYEVIVRTLEVTVRMLAKASGIGRLNWTGGSSSKMVHSHPGSLVLPVD